MKIIDFTKAQELLVPPKSDPYQAIDDDLLDRIVQEMNTNVLRMGTAQNVKRKSRKKFGKI